MNNVMTAWIVLFSLIIFLLSCSAPKEVSIPRVNELNNLQIMMTGSYDSAKQEALDSAYYNISLHMYPIWGSRKDGKYLYVEQSLASMQDKPYRQRVYKLEKLNDGKIVSHIYTIKYDSIFVGKWRDPTYFDKFGLSILDKREGCEVILCKNSTGYEGSTQGNNCKSTLRGATYATSIVSMAANEITSWDQGFDDKGKQVWGATKGPYKFVKLKK